MRYLVLAVEDGKVEQTVSYLTLNAYRLVESITVVESSDREIIQDKDGDLWENYGQGEGTEKRFFLMADPTTTETLGTIVGVHGPIKRAAWY
jgi:hypothetical protein